MICVSHSRLNLADWYRIADSCSFTIKTTIKCNKFYWSVESMRSHYIFYSAWPSSGACVIKWDFLHECLKLCLKVLKFCCVHFFWIQREVVLFFCDCHVFRDMLLTWFYSCFISVGIFLYPILVFFWQWVGRDVSAISRTCKNNSIACPWRQRNYRTYHIFFLHSEKMYIV